MLKNFTIRKKLLFSFGLIIGLFLLFSILTIIEVFDIKYKQIGVRTTITQIRESLLLLSQNEKQFNYDINLNNTNNTLYSKGTNADIEEFKNNYNDINRNIAKLTEYYGHNDTVDNQKIGELQNDIVNYHDLFLLEVVKYRQKGNDDYGLLGRQEVAADALEEKLIDTYPRELFFQMRVREKEIAINKKKEEIAAFLDILAQLRKAVAANESYSTLLNTYSDSFTKILSLDQEIGIQQTDGVQGKILKNLNKSTTLLAGLEKDITVRTDQSLNLTILLLMLVSSICILVGTILALRISKQISEPLSSLETAAQEIANGNLKKRIVSPNQDEIGKVAAAFNRMADTLDEFYKSLESKVQEKTALLSEKLASLNEARKALTNVMEDMNIDKAKIDEQKKILDSVVHNMPIGVALSEPNGKTILINDSGTALLEGDLFGVDGTPYPPGELPTALALSEGRAITKDDILIHHHNGKILAMRETSAPIKNTQGFIVSIVSVFEDITREKDVDRMKTEFISLASHQLRTPLSAIRWFSEMLVGGDAGELTNEQKDFAQNIYESTQRMIDLVNSLLNISRIESGRILVDPVPTDLKELVQGVVVDLKAKITEKGHNLIISIRDDMPKINLDPRLIRQVYMNLLTNAIKYTPKGGEITVIISKKDDQVISQVTDNGYGIPVSQQSKIFQKFFRADNIIKVETDGTGLGLYLIKAVIESSKGKLWFDSAEGKGTSFWFSLPITGMEAKRGEVTLEGK